MLPETAADLRDKYPQTYELAFGTGKEPPVLPQILETDLAAVGRGISMRLRAPKAGASSVPGVSDGNLNMMCQLLQSVLGGGPAAALQRRGSQAAIGNGELPLHFMASSRDRAAAGMSSETSGAGGSDSPWVCA